MSNRLYPVITPVSFNGELVQTVNARDLHAKLGVKEKFSDWVKRYLAKFVENQDYVIFTCEPGLKGRPRTDYAFSLDMAKHVAMMSETEKSHEIRQYFIDVEKQYYQEFLAKDVHTPSTQHSDAVASAVEVVRRLGSIYAVLGEGGSMEELEFIECAVKVLFSRPTAQVAQALTPKQIGSLYGISGIRVNRLLKQLGLQTEGRYKQSWVPTGEGFPYVADTPHYCITWKPSVLVLLEGALRDADNVSAS